MPSVKNSGNLYSKTDLLLKYGVRMQVFENWIADKMDEFGWVKGKPQKFSPRIIRQIIEHVGEPL